MEAVTIEERGTIQRKTRDIAMDLLGDGSI
jgi:hypothetical protein